MRLSALYDQQQYTVIYSIQAVTENDQLQYTITFNIQLAIIYGHRKYDINDSIWSVRK